MAGRARFELVLFALDLDLVPLADEAGVDAFVVDWENRGKDDRQAGFDTQVNGQTVDDLVAVRERTSCHVICRVNPPGPWSEDEIASAVAAGADEVLVPMIRSAAEVHDLLAVADGRCALGILIETREAVAASRELGALPLSRVYLGLNDLAIARGSASIFEPLVDGLAEEVRRAVRAPFGLAGMTLPHLGDPVPARLLAGELARLDCDFTFLRRSFYRDVEPAGLADALEEIREAVERARLRSPEERGRDREELERVVAALAGASRDECVHA